MMKAKELILVMAMMGVLLITAFADDQDGFDQRRSEIMKERWTNFKENIKPKIDAQRNKLESSISTEDKNEISRLREEIIKQRLIENEFFFEARTARIKGEEFDEGLWQEIEAQKIVIENLKDQAKLIANKYRPEIDDLVANLREELREENGNTGQRRDDSGQGYGNRRKGPDTDGFRGRGFGQGPQAGFREGQDFQRGYKPMGFGPNINARLDIVTFLLWDVNRG